MTEKKMTKREYFTRILSYAHDEDKAFLEHELELLDRKNTAERKPTPKQVENAGYRDAILEWMERGVQYSCADIAKGCPAIVENGISVNRVTPMLTALVGMGKVVKTIEKRKSYYSLA